jgi:hypothetical protein
MGQGPSSLQLGKVFLFFPSCSQTFYVVFLPYLELYAQIWQISQSD